MNDSLAAKIDSFFKQYKHQLYKKGEMLIRADEQPSGIFYITSGVVKKYAISKKGDEVVVNLFKPISFFPMSWAMNDEKNKYFYEALENVEVYKAPRDAVNAFVLANPDVLYDLLQRVYKGIEGLLARTTHLMSGGAYERLITELIILAKRFGKQDGKSIIISTTEKDLAAETGMTRETISREIKKLKDKELITFSKNTIVIENMHMLEDVVADDF